MLTAILIFSGLSACLAGIALSAIGARDQRLENIEMLLTKLLNDPPTVGGPRLGRNWPTFQEIQSAKNRMDSFGTAHPGGP